MKRIALAALFALSTLAHADDVTVLSFVAADAGPHRIDIAAAPGSPRVSRTATLVYWNGEIDFAIGYEITFTADLAAGTRYQILIHNATPRGIASCPDVCPVQASIARL